MGSGADIPGPLSAIEVNNGNASSLFAAGKWVNFGQRCHCTLTFYIKVERWIKFVLDCLERCQVVNIGCEFFRLYLYGYSPSFFTTGSLFDEGTTVAQLTMVPILTTHTTNGLIESDRVLMISGSLSTSSGNSSSALYDGQTLIPYIISTSASGTSGSVSSLFHSFKSFSFNQRSEFSSSLVSW